MIHPIVAVTIENPVTGKKEDIYALLDTGADCDYISDKVAVKLGLKVDMKWSKIYGVNSVSDGMGKQANLIFKTFDRSYEATVNDALVGDFTAAEGDKAPAKRFVEISPSRRYRVHQHRLKS